MRITAEQATCVARYLQTKGSDVASARPSGYSPAPDDLIVRVVSSISSLPEVRAERVTAGRALLQSELPSSDEVAQRILWRIMADRAG